jgi:predicted transcriptional regulator
MDNIQLQLILDEAYSKTFLDKIEFLLEKEKDYKKSEFFRLTKIPLLALYEKFDGYKTRQKNIADEFNDFIYGIDNDLVVQKISEFIEVAEKDKKIVQTLNEIIENFNYEKISEIAEQVQKELNKIK